MTVRFHFLAPAILLASVMLRPSIEPVRAPRVKQVPPPALYADPEPLSPPTRPTWTEPDLHRNIDRGWTFYPEPVTYDLEDPDIQRILRKLDTMIVDLRFDSATLEDILSYLHHFSGVDIVLEAKVAEPIRPDPRFSVRTRDLVLKEVFEFVLSLQGMVYQLTNEKVVLVRDRIDPDRY